MKGEQEILLFIQEAECLQNKRVGNRFAGTTPSS